jgi:hypothetical protein
MRRLRELLRLKYDAGLSHRAIAQACGMGLGAVTTYLQRAAAAGLPWPLPDDLDDAALDARLFAPPASPAASDRVVPTGAPSHQELKNPGVTLALLWTEYRAEHRRGYPGLRGWGTRSTAAVLARYRRLESIPDDSRTWGVNAANPASLTLTGPRARSRIPVSGSGDTPKRRAALRVCRRAVLERSYFGVRGAWRAVRRGGERSAFTQTANVDAVRLFLFFRHLARLRLRFRQLTPRQPLRPVRSLTDNAGDDS